jgi:hypothetical protein
MAWAYLALQADLLSETDRPRHVEPSRLPDIARPRQNDHSGATRKATATIGPSSITAELGAQPKSRTDHAA